MGIYTSVSIGKKSDITLKTSVEGKPSLEVTPPPEFHGPEDKWSPEDLFSASISSCFILTFKAIASFKKLEWSEIEVKVDAKLEKTESGLKFTTVDIFPRLTVCCQGHDLDAYLKVLMTAKDGCLVTSSMNCDFKLHPKVLFKEK